MTSVTQSEDQIIGNHNDNHKLLKAEVDDDDDEHANGEVGYADVHAVHMIGS